MPYIVEAAARVLEHRVHPERRPLQQRAGPLAAALPHRDGRAAARHRGAEQTTGASAGDDPFDFSASVDEDEALRRPCERAEHASLRAAGRHARSPAQSQSRAATGCRPLAPVARTRNALRRVLQPL